MPVIITLENTMATTRKAVTPPVPSAKKVAGKKTAPAKKSPTARGPDAIALLKADHAEVKKRFKAYQKLVDNDAGAQDRQAVAEEICLLLTVHATIEEEIFYPAAREVLESDVDLADEADVEHASAKALIAQIRAMQPDQPLYNAKVKVLGEYVDHHVEEEQDEMFPKVKAGKLDTRAIGAQLAERKRALMAELTEGVEAVA